MNPGDDYQREVLDEQVDSDQQPEFAYGHNDNRPNAAWNYANTRTRGWGVWSGGQWLQSLDDFGPHFTHQDSEAQCFNSDAGAKRLGAMLLRHYIKNEITMPVFVHLIPRSR